jgi:hypothetical protein
VGKTKMRIWSMRVAVLVKAKVMLMAMVTERGMEMMDRIASVKKRAMEK